jgi:hypothetical protein
MSRFVTPLRAEEVDEFEGIDRLLEPLGYESDLLDCRVDAPTGFLTDWASVPRLPLMYLAYGGKGKKAAGIHDLLYHSRAVSREMADQVLREAMLACGYSRLTAWAFYQACRVGGQARWDQPNLQQSDAVEAAVAILRAKLAHLRPVVVEPQPENLA